MLEWWGAETDALGVAVVSDTEHVPPAEFENAYYDEPPNPAVAVGFN